MSTTAPAASARVLTDPFLFRRITAFQLGMAVPLFEFWRAYKPEDALLPLNERTSETLVQLLVEHGTVELFAMAERARYTKFLFRKRVSRPTILPLPLDYIAGTAILRNRAEIAEWALVSKRYKLHQPERAWMDAITHAREDGSTRLLDVLSEHAPLQTQAQKKRVMKRASEGIKHANVLRWLLNTFPEMPAKPYMVALAVQRCDLSMLQLLRKHPFTSRDRIRLENVLSARNIEVLAFFLEHFDENIDPRDMAAIASSSDPAIHQVALRFAWKLQPWCVSRINGSVESRNRVNEWVASGILSPKWPISIDTIASHGLLEMVRLLHEHGIATATTDAMDQAAEKGKWEVVEFLHYNRTEGCTTRAMDAALHQGNLKYVQFLRANRTEGFSRQAAEKAACNQSTVGFRYLHSHTDIHFTPAVMDAAAAHGSLSVVKFLHENRSEGCTTEAMDQAASRGHLRVVQYLHANRSEGCTFAALRGAIQTGELDVVSFLLHHYPHLFEPREGTSSGEPRRTSRSMLSSRSNFELDAFNEDFVATVVEWELRRNNRPGVVRLLFDRCPHLFTPNLQRDLLLGGMFDIYLELRSRYPEEPADPAIESALFDAGKTFELRTIRFIVDVLGRRDLGHHAMDGAAWVKHCGTHWLRAVYAIAGPQSCRLSAVRVAAQGGHGGLRSLDKVKFLICRCCEPNAKHVAIEAMRPYADAMKAEMCFWDPTAEVDDELPLHPFLVDPRVQRWAITDLFRCSSPMGVDPSWRMSSSWAIVAAVEHDLAMLEIIRDTPPTPDHTHSNHGQTMDADAVRRRLSYEGARAAAIKSGNLEMLQWLMEHVDLPVEPTLLAEAVFHGEREIAEWLVEHHPEACTEVQWESTHIKNCTKRFQMSEDLLDWLEHTPAVRGALDFGGVVGYLVQRSNVVSLGRLHAFDPSLVMLRSDLLVLAKQLKFSVVEAFLKEIQYHET